MKYQWTESLNSPSDSNCELSMSPSELSNSPEAKPQHFKSLLNVISSRAQQVAENKVSGCKKRGINLHLKGVFESPSWLSKASWSSWVRLKDVCPPVLLSGRPLCCFMVRRDSLLPNEAPEEVTGELLPSGWVTLSHVCFRTRVEGSAACKWCT